MNLNLDFNKIFQSKIFRIIILLIGVIAIFLIGFQAGLMVGFKKADFSYKWGENYHRNFAGPRGGFFGNLKDDFMKRDFINAHGVFGQIIKIDGATLIIKGANETEKVILLEENTTINRFQEKIKPEDLKIDDNIIVVGSPNDKGQIEAKLIRVLPPVLDGQFPAPVEKQN